MSVARFFRAPHGGDLLQRRCAARALPGVWGSLCLHSDERVQQEQSQEPGWILHCGWHHSQLRLKSLKNSISLFLLLPIALPPHEAAVFFLGLLVNERPYHVAPW
ncbi:hypothetical protein SRHO_G00199110 [Serrasalmus rhombeus]